jgi:SAM-dependent methyltransferase
MSMMQEIPVPDQVLLWDRRARDTDMLAQAADTRLALLLAGMEPKRRLALDVGCGCGRHLVLLASLGWRATGVDWSPEALLQSRRRLEAAGFLAETLKCDFRRIPLGNTDFTLIISTNAIHHGRLADMRRAILELKRLLKPGGACIVSVPGRHNAPAISTGNWVEEGTVILGDGAEAGIPHHFSSPFELEHMFSQFRDLKIETVVEPLPPGHPPLHREHQNEWHWVCVTG